MSTEVFRELLADALKTMSKEELVEVLIESPEEHLSVLGKAVLEKKREIGRSKGASGGAGGVSKANGESIVESQTGGTDCEAGPSARVEAMPRELEKEIPSRKRKQDECSLRDLGKEIETLHAKPKAFNKSDVLFRARWPDRQGLERMLLVIEGLDWTKVNSRTELVTCLFEGEVEQCRGKKHDLESIITTWKDMALFVQQQSHRLRGHMGFAAAFDKVDHHLEDSLPRHPTSRKMANLPVEPLHAIMNHSDRPPPFDWDVITRHLGYLKPFTRDLKRDHIIDDFCSALDSMTKQCPPGRHVDIDKLRELVHRMEDLAGNMSRASPPEMRNRLMNGRAIVQLRDVLSAVCSALSNHRRSALAIAIRKEEKEGMKEKLCMVYSNVRNVDPGQKLEAEVQKVCGVLD